MLSSFLPPFPSFFLPFISSSPCSQSSFPLLLPQVFAGGMETVPLVQSSLKEGAITCIRVAHFGVRSTCTYPHNLFTSLSPSLPPSLRPFLPPFSVPPSSLVPSFLPFIPPSPLLYLSLSNSLIHSLTLMFLSPPCRWVQSTSRTHPSFEDFHPSFSHVLASHGPCLFQRSRLSVWSDAPPIVGS